MVDSYHVTYPAGVSEFFKVSRPDAPLFATVCISSLIEAFGLLFSMCNHSLQAMLSVCVGAGRSVEL